MRPQARRKRLSETLLTSHRSPNSAMPAGNAARQSAAPWHWAALPLLPHLAFGCFAPHMARTRGASGELSIYLFYLLYLFYTPARASCRAACGAGCPRPPLCAAAVDARLTSEAVSAVNVDELRPPARHAGNADRPAHAPAHHPCDRRGARRRRLKSGSPCRSALDRFESQSYRVPRKTHTTRLLTADRRD